MLCGRRLQRNTTLWKLLLRCSLPRSWGLLLRSTIHLPQSVHAQAHTLKVTCVFSLFCLPCNGSNFFKQLDYVRNLIISQAGSLNFHYIIPSDRRLCDTGSRHRSTSHVFEWFRCSNSSQWCQRKGLWNRLPLGVSSFDIA